MSNKIIFTESYHNLPNKDGFYGPYGGRFVPEELIPALQEVEQAFLEAKNAPQFLEEYWGLLRDYVGRPSPLYFAKNLTAKLGGAKIYLKREDLNHTGAHKINHCLGEALLAKRLGKKKLLAETGAGQHGVALATAAAVMGLECEIHMGSIDVAKQQENVKRMRLLGAKVVEVNTGGQSLKDAVDSAFLTYMKEYKTTFFAIGSVVGPHPYPALVAYFQSIVGREAREQIMAKENRLPDMLVACVGGGSNALGLFHEFLDETSVKMVGAEPSGRGLGVGEHAATLTYGQPGTLHGMHTYLLQDEAEQPQPVHSIASGLDYPGIGPIHSFLKDTGRVEYLTVSDEEAVAAFSMLSKLEGIIPALESSHAIAQVIKIAPTMDPGQTIIVNLSGRGDKDLDYVEEKYGQIAFR
jgi:tryptophan synthase beta chain